MGLNPSQKCLVRHLGSRILVHLLGTTFCFVKPCRVSLTLPVLRHTGVKLIGKRYTLRNGQKEELLADGDGGHGVSIRVSMGFSSLLPHRKSHLEMHLCLTICQTAAQIAPC